MDPVRVLLQRILVRLAERFPGLAAQVRAHLTRRRRAVRARLQVRHPWLAGRVQAHRPFRALTHDTSSSSSGTVNRDRSTAIRRATAASRARSFRRHTYLTGSGIPFLVPLGAVAGRRSGSRSSARSTGTSPVGCHFRALPTPSDTAKLLFPAHELTP